MLKIYIVMIDSSEQEFFWEKVLFVTNDFDEVSNISAFLNHILPEPYRCGYRKILFEEK